jgi:hypothetical protein
MLERIGALRDCVDLQLKNNEYCEDHMKGDRCGDFVCKYCYKISINRDFFDGKEWHKINLENKGDKNE